MKIPIILTLCIGAVLATALIQGCQDGENTYERDRRGLNDIKRPCVVIAVKKDSCSGRSGGGSIILKGADNIYSTFDDRSSMGAALIASYKKGDTIK